MSPEPGTNVGTRNGPIACAVCGRPARVVYDSGAGLGPGEEAISITSLAAIRPGATRVGLCDGCGHLTTEQDLDTRDYYDREYTISLDSEDDDQLYQVVDGRPVYRVPHQVGVMLSGPAGRGLGAGARVLDFGCAKGASARALLAARPDVGVWLFDVSEMYTPFWARFRTPDRWATHRLPDAWNGAFDLVMSFFVLEHVPRPVGVLRDVRRLLAPGGRAHLVVPDISTNVADMIVADHANHFSRASLIAALTAAGLEPELVDSGAHVGAWTVTARACGSGPGGGSGPGEGSGASPACRPSELDLARAEALGRFWGRAVARVRAFEGEHAGPSAIYGSGVYGTFIASCLRDIDRVACVLDQSPFRQGKTVRGRPIIAPDRAPPSISAVYVGLNPARARDIVSRVAALQRPGPDGRPLRLLFLD